MIRVCEKERQALESTGKSCRDFSKSYLFVNIFSECEGMIKSMKGHEGGSEKSYCVIYSPVPGNYQTRFANFCLKVSESGITYLYICARVEWPNENTFKND